MLSQSKCPDWGIDKSSRRDFIAQSYPVLMLFGDDLGDFISENRGSTQMRIKEALKHDLWVTKWFMLPNPMHGSWESSLYDFDSDLSLEEISQCRFHQLR